MNRPYLAFFLVLAACSDKANEVDSGDTNGAVEASDTSADTDADTGADTGEVAEFGFSVAWGETAVTLTISGSTATYFWGIAETSDARDSWTGEDCLWGEQLSDGTYVSYCHVVESPGISLVYGGNVDALREGTTVFSDNSYADITTHYFEDTDTGDCWVMGAEPSYYSELGCTRL